MTRSNGILIKNADEIKKMEIAGHLTGKVLEAVRSIIVPGVTTLEIDAFCHDYITKTLNAIPGSLGQYDFPHTVNTSVNHVVCHGWPSGKKLKNGDIVNVDVTVKKEGYYGDSSITFCVGDVSSHAKRLVDITQQCLYRAIKIVKPGITLGDIGHTIQQHAEANNYSVVREYCGHGIGSSMHEAPQVLHYGKAGEGMILEEGMTFTIEPMINQGKKDVKLHKDGWTVTTKDRRLSAQFEHTILVTRDGFKVLTLRDEERETFESYLSGL
ncbi:type I methionyl aminopeptidase [Xenorhabdus sp. 42]|uniref:type I methionyl aminopeptidase n=1 Tax=Xenorhabdus szentirmaii TaxID=290112 RepID=UPI0019AC10A6|nr:MULTISPECIES: type I methionyl aminopeptidase [unclassified Xenorhabdus]MBD2781911.1 type I methionyl aminopeptidase [Xenorhabdus sp. 38]MBD2822695.1 type I methionyl aminopeptidase [Xenorhabdus sp. 42]